MILHFFVPYGLIVVAVGEVNWLVPPPTEAAPMRAEVKLRSAAPALPATILAAPGGGARVVMDSPAEAVAPGQACVFYAGDRVLGGGWISRAEALQEAPGEAVAAA